MSDLDSLYGWVTSLVVVAVVMTTGRFAMPAKWSLSVRQMVLLSLAVHIIGSVLRMTLMVLWYGRGDFLRYYSAGLDMATALRRFDVEPMMASPVLWGADFVDRVTAVLLVFIGPSIRGAFVVFSVLAAVGLILMAVTGIRAFPSGDGRRTFMLLLFWPSLIFWPSSIGKEALMLLAVGALVYGWWGDGHRVRWPPLVFGVALAFFIRPHIAMMLTIALGAADWLGPMRKMDASKIVRGVFLAGVALLVAAISLRQLGVEAEQEAVQAFVTERSARTAQGGSAFAATTGVLVVPMAFINVLARPFVWEAHNLLALISAAEVVFFWLLMWRRRVDVRVMIRHWRENRLLLLLVPMVCVLVVFYGAMVSNMGILARQRVVVLPLLFLIAEAAPSFRVKRDGPTSAAPGASSRKRAGHHATRARRSFV